MSKQFIESDFGNFNIESVAKFDFGSTGDWDSDFLMVHFRPNEFPGYSEWIFYGEEARRINYILLQSTTLREDYKQEGDSFADKFHHKAMPRFAKPKPAVFK